MQLTKDESKRENSADKLKSNSKTGCTYDNICNEW